MNKFLFSLAGAAMLFTACSKSEDGPPPASPTARVMFVNATRSADTIRAHVNDTLVAGADAIVQLTNTSYYPVAPGTKKLGFRFKDNSPLSDTTMSLTGNSSYTAFSIGTLQSSGILVTTDDLTAPAAGNAKVRFINLSTDTSSYNAYVGTGDTASLNGNTAFGGVGPFKQFAAGTYKIIVERIKYTSGPPDVEEIPTFQLAQGKAYTVLLTGNTGLSGAAARKVWVIANN